MEYGISSQASQGNALPQVAIQINKSTEVRAALNDIVGTLENRLSPVLRNTGPDVHRENGEAKPGQIPVPLAETICDGNRDIERVCLRLRGIIDRLEI